MKKCFLLLLLFLFVGCEQPKQEKVKTIIEEDKNMLIGINYPVTSIPNFDKIIEEEIETIYHEFNHDYQNLSNLKEQSELNIDYKYQIINQTYYSVVLTVFINNSSLAHPVNYVKTYVFDTKNNKLVTLKELIDSSYQKDFVSLLRAKLFQQYSDCLLLDDVKTKLTDDLNSYPLFSLSKQDLIVYFNPADITASYCGILQIAIPYDKIGLQSFIQEEKAMQEIIVDEGKVLDPNDKFIALTFDDGPSKYTKEIIDYLHDQESNATFFVLGNKVELYQDILSLSIQYGNELGNHSYNHKWLLKLGTEDYVKQINQTQDILKEKLGYTPTLMRPTYGSLSEEMKKHTNLEIVLWNVDTKDWQSKNVDRIVKRATSGAKDGNIILMHDTKKQTVKAIKKIVPKLKEMGYQLVTVSELKEIQLLRSKLNEQ